MSEHRGRQLREKVAAWNWQDSGYVFTKKDGAHLDPRTLTHTFRWLVDNSDLPRIRLHDLRHTHASIAVKAGVPIGVVSERLGHAKAGYAVVTGGYGGIMEAASKGAAEAGGTALGVTAPALFPGRPGANRFVTEVVEAGSLAERIGRMILMSEGCMALPGSIGTATELLMAWNTNHIRRRSGLHRYPSVAVGRRWDGLRATLTRDLEAFDDDIYWAKSGSEGTKWLLTQINPLS